ncbi:MAG: cytochrome c [Geobacter sp.]|nr:cytochrome c [Geobacter sp.]
MIPSSCRVRLFTLFFAITSTACSQQSQPATPAVQPVQSDHIVRRFDELCAACHGKKGRGGGVGPDLSASRYKYGKERNRIIISISNGRPGGMPGYSSHLSAEDIAGLADYLISLH